MKLHTLNTDVMLDTSIEKCWRFFSDPQNLNAITPPDLDFQIITDLPAAMYNGLIIEYAINIPFFGRHRWLTEIRHIVENESFVDEQRCGPFRFWHHRHTLEEVNGRIKAGDQVTYVMPYGPIGELLHLLVVGRTLERIFTYRQLQLQKIFARE